MNAAKVRARIRAKRAKRIAELQLAAFVGELAREQGVDLAEL